MTYTAFEAAVKNAETVLLMPHVGPDADSLGSILGIKFGLEKTYPNLKHVHAVMAGPVPAVYRFLPGWQSVENIEDPDITQKLLPDYDVVIAADCGSLDRLGEPGRYFKAAKTSINLDHHVSNNRFGTLNIVEVDAGASGLVVARLFDTLGIAFDENIAPNLYAAIVTDTGGFKYSSTSVEIFELAARLMAAGANPETIYKYVYENRPVGQVRMQAEAVLRADYECDGRLAYTHVTRDDLARHNCPDEHVDGLVEQLRNIDTVKLAAVFKAHRDGTTKVSFRSDDPIYNVAEVAGQFGGGGHKMASGCTVEASMDEAKLRVLPLLKALL
ncbi:MAG: bifunctional oligoribonuclease/PAP phosphatase NrnA [Vampirovibrionales bacterium]|nr:bifunctional oligoribonuclease/PAP phosphatase NrnA [Vampirovibrionales bacterium]